MQRENSLCGIERNGENGRREKEGREGREWEEREGKGKGGKEREVIFCEYEQVLFSIRLS